MIQFSTGQTSLGTVTIAASEKGLAAILLGHSPADVTELIRIRFPRTQALAADAELKAVVAQVEACIEAPHLGVDLPLDMRGTPFQLLVWRTLCNIPPGQTATYSEVAACIGRPKAIRAVASACAANKLAVVIPCHRVVPKSGPMSGYAWGVERKLALLARERAASFDPAAALTLGLPVSRQRQQKYAQEV